MTAIDQPGGTGEKVTTIETERTRTVGASLRLRRFAAVLLLVLTPALTGCTPEEIEASVGRIAVGFEEGGVERGLADAIFVVDLAIPVIGMRLGSAFGP
jgi:hypothetical protein